MRKRILSLALILSMALSLLPFGAHAAEIVESGSCGEGVTWTLDSDGLLRISGNGRISINETYDSNLRWNSMPFRTTIYSIVIEPGVTGIGARAFDGFFRVTSVSIPNTVTEIGEYAFSSCRGLRQISIPPSVKSIAQYAFFYCDALTTVRLSEGLSTLGEGTFDICSSLEELTVPESVTSLGDWFCSGCESLKSVVLSDGLTAIPYSAFFRCTSLERVTVPESVTEIGESAFSGCRALKNVQIPESVTEIGESAFLWCSALENVQIPAGVTIIRADTFLGCSSLTELILPEGVTEIESRAFEASGLTSVTLPDSLTDLWPGAFANCPDLTAFHVSGQHPMFTAVDGVLFSRDQTWLICCPGGVTGAYVIPEGVTNLDDDAFCGCSGLTEIEIPESVTDLGSYAFSRCSGLATVVLPDGISSIPTGAFSGCSGLTEIRIPESVTDFGSHAFSSCSGLTRVILPEGVTSIGEGTFADCSNLRRVFIPGSLEQVEDRVFGHCPVLLDVLFAGTENQWHFLRSGEWQDGSAALGLSSKVRIHFGVTDPETHIREDAVTTPSGETVRHYSCDCGYSFTDDASDVDEFGFPSVLPEDSEVLTADGTRYGLMHLLWTIAGCPAPESTNNPYIDLPQNRAPAVLWAGEQGLTKGVSETLFAPDEALNRAQAVTILWRFAGSPEPPITEAPFTDVERGHYCYQALLWAYGTGAVRLEDAPLFEPDAEVASVSFDPKTHTFSMETALPQDQPEEPSTIGFGRWTQITGECYITNCNVPNGIPMPETLVVPGEYNGSVIYGLDEYAFQELTTLKTLYLPLSLRDVLNHALPSSLETIYYAGCSQTQWEQIDFHSNDLSHVTVHYRAHSWDDGALDENGLRHYTCASCGETMTAVERKTASGVKVLSEPEQREHMQNVILQAEQNTTETTAAANVVLQEAPDTARVRAYDLHLVNTAGEAVQPEAAVTVVLPIPAGWDPNAIVVYYADPATGRTEIMNAVPSSDGKTVSFQTTHFSCYVLAQKATEPVPVIPFNDVPAGQYYAEPVLWAVNHEPQITNGTSPTTFEPEKTCTRGQVVTFLWRAMGCPEPKSLKNPFTDVSSGDYYYKAVLWAAEKNITNGTSPTTFSPNNPCTRAHVVTFLWRAHEKPAAGGRNPFTDVSAGLYYSDAVLWAVSREITNGTSPTTFSPDRHCTRGQIVTFLHRDLK